MQIDRSNYEVWFLDWQDGNLNSRQVEQLMLFLDQNQDLKEEFHDLTTINLVSPTVPFRHKEELKKSPSDISPSQFDHFCAACLENDLTENDKADLQEIINIYPDRKRAFDLMQRTILTPPLTSYRYKKRLLRRTPLQNAIRISVTGLSAAAAISIIIIIYSVIPGTFTVNKINSSEIIHDSTFKGPSEVMAVVPEDHILPTAPQENGKMPEISKSHPGASPDSYREAVGISVNLSGRAPETSSSNDSSLRTFNKQAEAVIRVPVNRKVDLGKSIPTNTLIASSQVIDIPPSGDERSQVGKFISKTFREKILKQKTPHDNPLKGFEIAEAGVAGLNKLFGWQMALDMKNDDNGQPKSFYFSSKILKVNAPVKKRETQP